MNILFITDTFHPMKDGITKTITALGKGLNQLGHQVTYLACTTDTKASYPNTTYYKGIPFYGYKEYGINLFEISLEKHILDKKPDVIHIHSPAGLGLQAAAIAKKNRIPFLFTYHTNLVEQVHYLPFYKILRQFYIYLIKETIRHFTRNASAVISLSKYAQKMLKSFDINSMIIPNAVNDSKFYPEIEKDYFVRYNVPMGTKIVLIVGRLIREKNLDNILDIATKINHTSFVFVGRGPYGQKLKTRAKKLKILDKKIFFLENIADNELRKCYSNADLLFFPSKYDTFGLVAIESLMCGSPVLVPKQSAQREFANYSGVFLYEDGIELESIRRVLMGKNKPTQKTIVQLKNRYGRKAIALKHIKLYEKIIKNRLIG